MQHTIPRLAYFYINNTKNNLFKSIVNQERSAFGAEDNKLASSLSSGVLGIFSENSAMALDKVEYNLLPRPFVPGLVETVIFPSSVRDNNIWIGLNWFLPTGRSGKMGFDEERNLVVSEQEKSIVRDTVQRVDRAYGFNHPVYSNFATHPCVEFMEIFGDGRVSPCSGNDTTVGNIKTEPLSVIRDRILQEYPCHNLQTFDGHCLYRPRIQIGAE